MFDTDPDTGALSGQRRLAEVSGGLPDGLTLDAEGCLWLAVWGSSELRRYTPDGRLDTIVTLPGAPPASPAARRSYSAASTEENPRKRTGGNRIPPACPGSVPLPQGLTERSEGMMAADRQAEIAASVAALKDLGPGYDQALAEGLVERIGTEIDKRIAAEIDNRVTAEVDSRILTQLDRYAGCRHQRRRARRISRAERRMIRAERADRSGLRSIMLALGSMLVALPVTAIVLNGSPGVAAIMLMALVWIIVGIINVAYATRKHPQQ